MLFPVLAGLGALSMMSNPRRRHAKSRRRVSRNPKQRDLSVDVKRVGNVVVTIVRWRNANATAFVNVTADGEKLGVKTWEAKSQGPSSGGYNKAVQALEKVVHKMTGYYPSLSGENLTVVAAIAADALKRARSNPRRAKKRRKAKRRR